MADSTRLFNVSFVGNDGSEHELDAEHTWDGLQEYITFIEERGCHTISVYDLAIEEGLEVYAQGGKTEHWGWDLKKLDTMSTKIEMNEDSMRHEFRFQWENNLGMVFVNLTDATVQDMIIKYVKLQREGKQNVLVELPWKYPAPDRTVEAIRYDDWICNPVDGLTSLCTKCGAIMDWYLTDIQLSADVGEEDDMCELALEEMALMVLTEKITLHQRFNELLLNADASIK